jgi:hypothetical protein
MGLRAGAGQSVAHKEYGAPMRHVVYAVRFRGDASWIGVDGNLLRLVARSSGSAMRSWVDRSGLHGEVHDEAGGEIRLESELTITGATTFQEIGSIAFGESGDCLRVSTCGSGRWEPAGQEGDRSGAAVLQVDGGDRRFAGAHGLITSTYAVDDAGVITVLQLGSLFLRDGGPDTPSDELPGEHH